MNNGVSTDKAGFICLDGNRVVGSFHDESGQRYFSECNHEEMNDWSAQIGATHLIECSNDRNWGMRYAKVLKTVVHVAVDVDENDQPVWESWPIRGHKFFKNEVTV